MARRRSANPGRRARFKSAGLSVARKRNRGADMRVNARRLRARSCVKVNVTFHRLLGFSPARLENVHSWGAASDDLPTWHITATCRSFALASASRGPCIGRGEQRVDCSIDISFSADLGKHASEEHGESNRKGHDKADKPIVLAFSSVVCDSLDRDIKRYPPREVS